MSGPPVPPLLDLLEPGWRRHLASGEPAGSLDVEPEMLATVAKALGDLSRSTPPAVLSRRWPAGVVVAIAQVTAHQDTTGRVWPAWHRAAGTRATKRSTADWTGAFLAALAALGVPAAGSPHETVLAHAAVTGPCLPEFLRMAGAGAPERELAGLDPAVAALLRLPAGTGFVARCRALMELLARSHEPAAGELADLSLPRRILGAARAVAAAHPGPPGGPPLRLDPFGRGVLARDADAAPGDAGCGRDDAGSWAAVSPGEVTDPADPLLAFDANGEPVGEVLPPEALWLVHREDRALRGDTAPRVLVESRLPLTWTGWRLVQVSLSGLAWLELEPEDDEAPRRRPVRGGAGPRLVTGAPVPGVRTTAGHAVFATLPALRLPAGEARWRIEVRRAGSGRVVGAAESSGDGWDPRRLWDLAPRPVLGELVVTVTALRRQPRERHPGPPGLRRVVAVAEGLGAAYAPALRLPCREGLEPAEAVLSAAPGMTASPWAATIPAGLTGADVVCVAGPVVLPLRVTPPHWRIRIEPEPGSGNAPTAWHSLGPLPLEMADLVRGGALRMDLPWAAAASPVDVAAAPGIVQVLEPSKQGRYPLRRMLDTISAHGSAELRITIGDRSAVIARVAAPEPATDPWLPG
jgi:hypothetical protein